MGLLLATRTRGPSLTDAFNMARRQPFFPALNTAKSGTWAWAASASKQFGGAYENSSAASGDYVEWANVNAFAANAKLKLLYTKSSNGGIVKILWGGSELGTLDTYAASPTYNNVSTVDLGTVTAGRGTLKLISDTKNASSSGYKISIQQVEVVQLTGSTAGTSLDDLPWVSDVPPISYSAASHAVVLAQDTTGAWGSRLYSDSVINNTLTWEVYVPPGNCTLTNVCRKHNIGGIISWYLDSVSPANKIGETDQYNATTTWNNLDTISFVNTTNGGKRNLIAKVEAKHASSSAYYQFHQWIQIRKTSTTGAITPTVATYGRETMELWPWFADTTSASTFTVSASQLHYGSLKNVDVLNDYHEYSQSGNPGTYTVTEYALKAAAHGIVHLSIGGAADLATVDHYNATTTYNNALAMSGAALVAGALRFAVDSKNASASDYDTGDTMIRLVRTGA